MNQPHSMVAAVLLSWTLLSLGCGRSQEPAATGTTATTSVTPDTQQPPPSSSADSSRPAAGDSRPPANSGRPAPQPSPADEPEPPQLEMPVPKLSKAHLEKCLVLVGESFPSVKLRDLEGTEHDTGAMLGPRATVVVFWSSRNIYSAPLLSDMQFDVFQRYADQGVNVIGVNVKDDPAAASQMIGEQEVRFPVLLDPDGLFFALVARDGLPRLYLVDPQGKLLWFDIEYSRDTREQLDQALRYTLGER